MDQAKRIAGRPLIMDNRYSRDSELYIKTGSIDGRTSLADYFFTAPFKIAKPFWDEQKNILNIIVMSASAGIMEGDRYRTSLELGAGARVSLQGQSYTKIHRMPKGRAEQRNRFFLTAGALLDYAPQPTIPYAGSSLHSVTECFLQSGSALLYSDIFACGRVKRGERFAFREYKNCLKVYCQDELVLLDHQVLLPGSQNLEGIGFFESFTHQATLAFIHDGFDRQLPDRLFDILKEYADIEFGLTEIKKCGLMVRILGNSAEHLTRVIDDLKQPLLQPQISPFFLD